MEPFDTVGFKVYIDGVEVIIDFSDHLKVLPGYDSESDVPYFKYHYDVDHHGRYQRVYPLCPVSFHSWVNYFNTKHRTDYKAVGRILNNQRPGGNATERREKVQSILNDAFGVHVDMNFYPNQGVFWSLINDCLVSVCVPGARNDILDRGQFQYMALGCCTISPRIRCVLPWYRRLEPGIHFVECKSDYTDLVKKIHWCGANQKGCIQIGENAKELFYKTSIPSVLVKWMMKCIKRN
jgi:hypothetical protein